MKSKLLSLALVSVVGVACNKAADPAPTATAGSSAAPVAAPASTPPSPTVTPPADLSANEACKVLSKADAEAWIGHPLDLNEGGPMPVGFDCKYKTKKPYSSVSIVFYTADGASVMTKNKAAMLFGKTPVDIAGVGTAAIRSSDNNAVGVVANGKMAYLLLVGTPPSAAAAEMVAKAVATKM